MYFGYITDGSIWPSHSSNSDLNAKPQTTMPFQISSFLSRRPAFVVTSLLVMVSLSIGCGAQETEATLSSSETTNNSGLDRDKRQSNRSDKLTPVETASDVIVFKEHKVTDPGMNNAVISTILVPEGWKVEGGATRTQLFNMPVLIDVGITAPDGRTAHFFPSLSFEFNNQYGGGQKMQPLQSGNLYYPLPNSPGEWMMELAKMNPAPDVSNVRLVKEEDIPEITQTLQQQNAQRYQSVAQLNQTTAQMGFGTTFDAKATKVILQYDKGGKTIEETVVIAFMYEVMVNQGQVTSGSWNVMMMQSIGGPVGTNYIDDPALNAIFQSIRTNPQWEAEMNKYWMEISRIRHKGNMDAIRSAGKISQIQSDAASSVNDITMQGWRNNNASSDRIQSNTVNAINDQTVYQTPSGQSVTLPSFYDNVHTDGNGRYLLHNDANYEPNRDPAMNSQNWQRVQQKN